MDDNGDVEIEAIGEVSKALSSLEEEARDRVIRWAAERYGVALGTRAQGSLSDIRFPGDRQEADGATDGHRIAPAREEPPEWGHFAELFDASGATTHPESMLVAAYWVQEIQGRDSFGSLELNRLLKDLGRGVTGTAKVMSSLIERKPALVLQLRKSGSSQQARKVYRLTEAGKKTVDHMISNGA